MTNASGDHKQPKATGLAVDRLEAHGLTSFEGIVGTGENGTITDFDVDKFVEHLLLSGYGEHPANTKPNDELAHVKASDPEALMPIMDDETPDNVRPFNRFGGSVLASPVTRAWAQRLGIPEDVFKTIQGTGPKGRIVKDDISAFVARQLGLTLQDFQEREGSGYLGEIIAVDVEAFCKEKGINEIFVIPVSPDRSQQPLADAASYLVATEQRGEAQQTAADTSATGEPSSPIRLSNKQAYDGYKTIVELKFKTPSDDTGLFNPTQLSKLVRSHPAVQENAGSIQNIGVAYKTKSAKPGRDGEPKYFSNTITITINSSSELADTAVVNATRDAFEQMGFHTIKGHSAKMQTIKSPTAQITYQAVPQVG